MIIKERSISLMWRLNPTVFQVLNAESMGEYTRRLGSAVHIVNALCSRTEEMKALLPTVLGVSPDNTSVNWQAKVSNYWHNFALEVLPAGMKFNISYKFDLLDSNDSRRMKAITAILDKLKLKADVTIEDKEKALVAYLFGLNKDNKPNVNEEELYQYGVPVDIEQYLQWRYCLLTSQVANRPEDVFKSNKIRFYLHNEEEAKKTKKDAMVKANSAINEYAKLMSKDDSMTIISALCIVYKLCTWTEFKEAIDEDKQGYVINFATSKPIDFLIAIKDINLINKATVQQYIYAGFLNELPSSSIIIDASDPSKVIGDNMDGAIAFLANETNKAYASELKAKFKSLN